MGMKPQVKMADKDWKAHTSDTLLEDVRERQRNIVWPDPLRNGRSVDAVLWKGSRSTSTNQRVGVAIFGLAFLVAGLGFACIAYLGRDVVPAVVAISPTLIGIRLFGNALRH